MRYPAVSGKFYPSDGDELRKSIENLYMGPLGPGFLPSHFSGEKDVAGVVSPHAGYVFSGQVAAHSYLEISRGSRPDTVVIIGPNHTGMGAPVSLTHHDYLTPLGVARTDKEMVESILEHENFIKDDAAAHRYEHSVEVQVPFLQHIDPDLRIVPVVMMYQKPDAALLLAQAVRGAAAELGRKVLVVASSDFSHYVPPSVAKERDGLAIEKIEEMDAKGLYNTVRRYGISMCGYGPVMAMLEFASMNGAVNSRLLKYATSGDIQPMEEVVGYAAIAVYR